MSQHGVRRMSSTVKDAYTYVSLRWRGGALTRGLPWHGSGSALLEKARAKLIEVEGEAAAAKLKPVPAAPSGTKEKEDGLRTVPIQVRVTAHGLVVIIQEDSAEGCPSVWFGCRLATGRRSARLAGVGPCWRRAL